MPAHSPSRWWSWLVLATVAVAVTGAWFSADASAADTGRDARKALCLHDF